MPTMMMLVTASGGTADASKDMATVRVAAVIMMVISADAYAEQNMIDIEITK